MQTNFTSIYKDLYNRVELDETFFKVQDDVLTSVDEESQIHLDRIKQNIVREAINNLTRRMHCSLCPQISS